MSVVVRKLRTLQRVVRTRGLRGVSSTVVEKVGPRYREVRRTSAMLADILAARLRHGRPRMVLARRGGAGDGLLCTVILRELRRRGFGPVWVLSNHADIYERNDDVAA